MKIGSLFSGYGGLDLGVQAALGGDVAWHVEYDKAPSRILDHHWPDVPNYGDVTAVDFTAIEPVDVLTGGYPCQPFSHAGKRKGTDDDRHLWPHVLRALRDMGPSLAVLENVRGHLSLGFDVVLADLADIGWSAEWVVVRASDVGAPHQRARLFIVAYPGGRSFPWPAKQHDGLRIASERGSGTPADAESNEQREPSELGPLRAQPWHGHRATADSKGSGRVRAPQHENDGADSGRGWRHDVANLGQGSGPSTSADTDLTGREAWRNAGQDGERIRVKPLGPAQPVADPHLAGPQGRQPAGQRDVSTWGDYGPAIARWEHITGRPAPAPTEPGRTGQPRLSPAFVEWMMGLPQGHVTDPAIGISRNDQLKALGNGVVPQQAAYALSLLLPRIGEVAA